MRSLSPEAIIHLGLTRKEVESKKRKRYGFHIFLSYYFLKYNNIETKEEKLEFLGRKVPVVDEEESVDSTDTPILERTFFNITRMDIFKTACFLWSSSYSTEQKDAWDQRAKKLNKRRIPGEYVALPLSLYGSNIKELTTAIQQSLYLEWQELRRIWKSFLTRSMASKVRQKHYTFGMEDVRIGRQSYGRFFLSLLLRQSLFGNDNNIFFKKK